MAVRSLVRGWPLLRPSTGTVAKIHRYLEPLRLISSLPPVDITTGLVVSNGNVLMNLPLPGVPGLTPVSARVKAPLHELVANLRRLDSSVTDVEFINSLGQRVAVSTALGDVIGQKLVITMAGGARIQVVDQKGASWTGQGNEREDDDIPLPQTYTQLKTEVSNSGRRTMSEEDFSALCCEVHLLSDSADPSDVNSEVVEKWLARLVSDGLVFTADKGRVVLFNPSSPGISKEIADTLLRDNTVMDQKIEGLHQQLATLEKEDQRLESIQERLKTKARQNVTMKKFGVLGFMTAQFGGLAYCVYEVYSWDIMEPATYFLMLSYSVGSVLYFSFKKRDASFSNLLSAAFEKQEKKLAPSLGYSQEVHADLKAEMDRYRETISLLQSRTRDDD